MRHRFYDEETKPKSGSPTREEAKFPETKIGKIVKASCLNVRVIPSKHGNVVTVLPWGTEVEIVKTLEKEQYYKVRHNGRVGYIPFDFCEVQ